MMQSNYSDGLSVIILSYERMKALEENLLSILMQNMDGIPLEIIVINNSNQIMLKSSPFNAVGRILRQNPQIKVINSRHNWRTDIRYGIAYSALYDMIMFIDDDISLDDPNLIYDMYHQKQKLGTYDLLSSWNTLWIECSETGVKQIPVTLFNPNLNELIKCDVCGPGICMFNRQLIMDIRVRNLIIPLDYPAATDMVLGLLPNYFFGASTYYFPAYKRAHFHDQHLEKALHQMDNFISDRFRLFKSLWKSGYQPVLQRETLDASSPEMRAIEVTEIVTKLW